MSRTMQEDGSAAEAGTQTGNYRVPAYAVGAELSEPEAKTSALAARPGAMLLDYLRVVVKDTPGAWAGLRKWLGTMTARPIGWRGVYDQSWQVLDGGLVAANSDAELQAERGILVDLPGAACGVLEQEGKLKPFLRWCLEVGHVARADWAVDDRAGVLTLERIETAIEAGAVVSLWRNVNSTGKRRLRPGGADTVGWTRYFGSREGAAMARIYDKRAEQLQKRPDTAKDLPAHWVRFEFETHDRLADRLCRAYFERGTVAVVEQVTRYISFRLPLADSNNRRWPLAPWWAEFIGAVKPGDSLLAGEKPTATIDNAVANIERMAAPWIAAVTAARGGDLTWLHDMIPGGAARWKAKHETALKAYQKDREKDAPGGLLALKLERAYQDQAH